jgi:cytochrome c
MNRTMTRLAGACIAATLAGGAVADDFFEVLDTKEAEWRAAGMNDALLAQVLDGALVYIDHCAACHGDDGQGGQGYAHAIIGTRGLDKFGTAHRLFVYNRQMMPFSQPGSLAAEEVWRVTAWLMAMNGWLDALDAPLGMDNARTVRIGG